MASLKSLMAKRFPVPAIFVLRNKVKMPAPLLARRIVKRTFGKRHLNTLARHADGLGYRRVLNIIRQLEARAA